MRKALIHLHLYYPDQVDYFIDKLKNINGELTWDFVVTYPSEDTEVVEKLRAFKPETKFRLTENTGYDILPFIKVIRDINLNDYDYVVKLHTKRGYPRKHQPGVIDFNWRDTLVNAILKDKRQFRKVIDIFENNPEIGMVSSLKYFTDKDFYGDYVVKELGKLGLTEKKGETLMGAMFMARAEVLKPLQNDVIDFSKFSKGGSASGSNVSLAHIYERVFSHLPENLGMKHKGVATSLSENIGWRVQKTLNKAASGILSIERTGPSKKKMVKVLGIPVYVSKRGKCEEDAQMLKELYDAK